MSIYTFAPGDKVRVIDQESGEDIGETFTIDSGPYSHRFHTIFQYAYLIRNDMGFAFVNAEQLRPERRCKNCGCRIED